MEGKNLLLATSHGLAVCESTAEGWRVFQRDLPGSYITSMIAQGRVVIAGSKEGVFRSGDAGVSWQAANNDLSIRHIRWLMFHPDDPKRVFAGTEPAGIFLSQNGGQTWKTRPEVVDLREGHGWYLPYSPEAGCVRGFAFHGNRGVAAVEVGGLLISEDFGETWRLGTGGQSPGNNLHPDVHSIAIHPHSPNLVAAATGGGFYLSGDGGRTWSNRYQDCYCRAFWWDPTDVDHIILGSADWVDRNGRIEETHDGGQTWSEAVNGLDLPWSNHMVEGLTQFGDQLLAVLSNGELLGTSLSSIAWERLLPEVRAVHAVVGIDLTSRGAI